MYRLREIERTDIPTINSWRSNRELIDFLGAPYRYINNEVDFKWFDQHMQSRDLNIRCAITDDNDHLLGLVSLTNINRLNQTAVFHIMIGDHSNRNIGLGKFAINEILRYAFNDMNLNRVELSVLECNKRAIALYEKFSFKREGIKREAVYKNGNYVNVIIMAVLKEEFDYKKYRYMEEK